MFRKGADHVEADDAAMGAEEPYSRHALGKESQVERDLRQVEGCFATAEPTRWPKASDATLLHRAASLALSTARISRER